MAWLLCMFFSATCHWTSEECHDYYARIVPNWSDEFNYTINSLLQHEPPEAVQHCVRPSDERMKKVIPTDIDGYIPAHCYNNKADPSYFEKVGECIFNHFTDNLDNLDAKSRLYIKDIAESIVAAQSGSICRTRNIREYEWKYDLGVKFLFPVSPVLICLKIKTPLSKSEFLDAVCDPNLLARVEHCTKVPKPEKLTLTTEIPVPWTGRNKDGQKVNGKVKAKKKGENSGAMVGVCDLLIVLIVVYNMLIVVRNLYEL